MKQTYFGSSAVALMLGCLVFQPFAVEAQNNNCGITIASVESFQPGKRRDGSLVPEQFLNTQNVIGVPQNSDAGAVNYTTLGFNGEITVKLSGKIANGEGPDFRLVETTTNPSFNTCSRYPERVEVFGSQDGCNFVCLGIVCQDANIDLAGSGLEWVEYVKLHDVSPVLNPFNNDLSANGYDLDGITCLSGVAQDPTPNTTFLAGSPRNFIDYLPANPNTIPLSRRNPLNATGAPQNNNGTPITFVSLGFGGEITLVFDYVVFDKEGPDLFLTETSGSTNYPERAELYGSTCGSNWVLLNNTEDGNVLTQDGWIDFSGSIYALKFLRIIDRSRRSQFTGAADGYDVDGVTVINGSQCTPGTSISIARLEDGLSNVPDEAGRVEVFPNPFHGLTQLQLTAGSADEVFELNLNSITGQRVSSERVSIAAGESLQRSIDLSAFNKGIYILELRGTYGVETLKLINQ